MSTALVTGSSRGIGQAIASRLEAGGVSVIGHSRSEANMASLDEIEGFFGRLAGARLDVLVINAGIWKPSPLGSTTRERLDELIAVNLRAPFWVMQCALPLLNDGARVINISSVAARTGIAGGRSVYSATKAGLEALTRNWAIELAPRRILVNAVAPGYVESDMTREHLGDPSTRRRALDRHPLGRLGQPDDVAGVVAFLCSAQAGFITGQILNASGGFVL